MAQLYQALAYLHSTGIVHCDIKPSNVLVTVEGRVKVVDFGLATDMSHLLTDHTVKVRGTPAYVAPEQAAGLPPTSASDWYGVGVMLFEALTGKRPFASTVTQVLEVKQLQSAPSPASLVSGLPEALIDLCCRLLERNPALRPSDPDVLAALGRIWPTASLATQPASPRIDHVPLVGRVAQLEVLSKAFDSCSRRPQMVILHGESGMGKSFLVRGFLSRVREGGAQAVILEGRCSERESVPYKALDSLIDHLADYLGALPPATVLELVGAECGALVRLFPVLRRVEAIESSRSATLIKELQELRRRGAEALRDLLRRIAARRPLVLVIDDLQWTDADSAALLDDVLFGKAGLPLLFIGCYRTEEASTNVALNTFLEMAQAADREGVCALHTVVLNELSPLEARELAARLMQQNRLGDVDRRDRRRVGRESAIHPPARSVRRHRSCSSFLVTRCRCRTGSWRDDPRRRHPRPQRRLRYLTPVACWKCWLCTGGPLDVRLAADVANLGEEAYGNSVALRTGRLARSRIAGSAEKLEVYHDRIREAIVDDISPVALKAIHSRLAHALERSADADPESLMHHFEGAGEDQAAAAHAVVAADRARDALAFDRASRLYRFALDRGRFDDLGQSIRIQLADALAASGRGHDAAHAYLEAASHAASTDVLDLQRRASEQLLQSGHLDEGMTIVGDVLSRVGLRLPRTPNRALISLLALRARIALRGFRFTERDERSIAPDALMRVDATWSVTTGLAIVDHIRSAEFGARNLLLALDAGEPLRIVRALAMELAYTSIAGARSQPYNDKLIAIGERLANRVPNPEAGALLMLAKGSADYMQGKWSSARELCSQATRILTEQCTRVSWQIDTAQFYTLLSSFYLGDLGDISQRLPTLLKDARDRDALYAETTLRTRIAFLASLAADDVNGAEKGVREGMERWSHKGFHNQHYYEMVACAETQLYAGRGVEAWTGLEGKWPDLRRTLLLRVQPVLIESVHLRGRAAIAAALATSGDERMVFVRHAEQSARTIEKTRAPWAIGLAQLTRSGIATLRAARPKRLRTSTGQRPRSSARA